jgi:hypothetical protein
MQNIDADNTKLVVYDYGTGKIILHGVDYPCNHHMIVDLRDIKERRCGGLKATIIIKCFECKTEEQRIMNFHPDLGRNIHLGVKRVMKDTGEDVIS